MITISSRARYREAEEAAGFVTVAGAVASEEGQGEGCAADEERTHVAEALVDGKLFLADAQRLVEPAPSLVDVGYSSLGYGARAHVTDALENGEQFLL